MLPVRMTPRSCPSFLWNRKTGCRSGAWRERATSERVDERRFSRAVLTRQQRGLAVRVQCVDSPVKKAPVEHLEELQMESSLHLGIKKLVRHIPPPDSRILSVSVLFAEDVLELVPEFRDELRVYLGLEYPADFECPVKRAGAFHFPDERKAAEPVQGFV